MSVTFFTAPQSMTFVDQISHHVQNPYDLLPGQTYDVFAVLANTDPVEARGVQVKVSHSAFGIGIPGSRSNLVQPPPMNVPPALDSNTPGLATVQFVFTIPSAGYGCLYAIIQPTGAILQQNLSVYSVVPGVRTTLSFLVFGSLIGPEQMTVELTETMSNGSEVLPANSWKPLLVAPGGLTPGILPISAPITLSLGKGTIYSIGLQVTVPPTATQQHIFHITGTIQRQADAGMVDIVVLPTGKSRVPPHPYIRGSYHSPDIRLIDSLTNLPVPMFGDPSDPRTMVRPDTDYGLQAIVRNDSPTPAVNTTVRFWEYDSLSRIGIPIDVQTANVPANGQVTVVSAHPFHSASTGRYRCAAVSIYNSQSARQTDCSVHYDTAQNPHYTIRGPGDQTGALTCSTWRNTHSMPVLVGQPWQLRLDLGHPLTEEIPAELLVQIDVTTQRVPADHATNPQVVQANQTLHELGGQAILPTYMLSTIRPTLPTVDLAVQIESGELSVTRIAKQPDAASSDSESESESGTDRSVSAVAILPTGRPAPITVHGLTPQDATEGDIYLIEVAAHYPQPRPTPPETVRSTYTLHVRK